MPRNRGRRKRPVATYETISPVSKRTQNGFQRAVKIGGNHGSSDVFDTHYSGSKWSIGGWNFFYVTVGANRTFLFSTRPQVPIAPRSPGKRPVSPTHGCGPAACCRAR